MYSIAGDVFSFEQYNASRARDGVELLLLLFREILTLTTHNLSCKLIKQVISCRRRTRAARCLTSIVLHTEVDAQCDKLASVVSRTPTVAGIVKLGRPTTVGSSLHWTSTFVEQSWQHVAMTDVPWRRFYFQVQSLAKVP